MDSSGFSFAAVVVGVLTLLCWYLISRRSRAASLSSRELDHHKYHGRAPSATEATVWMRCIDGERKWTPLADDHNAADAREVDREYNLVKCGATVPNGSPHSVTLSSGRKLTFDWTNEPSTHTKTISNIRCVGKKKCSTLELIEVA
jgi:hypothetical protein